VFITVLVLFVFYLYHITNLALWLQHFNKLTYILTYLHAPPAVKEVLRFRRKGHRVQQVRIPRRPGRCHRQFCSEYHKVRSSDRSCCYTLQLQLIKRHHLTPHGYADDTQIYGYCQSSDAGILAQRVSVCIDEVSAWMKANRLQLNPTKRFWCASLRRQHMIPTKSVRVDDVSLSPVTAVRDLGVYIDADVFMRTHVTTTLRGCFSALRQIRSVRRALPQLALLILVRSLVITKLDRCNSVLAGISRYLQERLQSVLNAAARLVYTHVGRQRIRLHCLGSCTADYASRSESSTGCVFWHTTVCTAQHRRI